MLIYEKGKTEFFVECCDQYPTDIAVYPSIPTAVGTIHCSVWMLSCLCGYFINFQKGSDS